MVTINKEGEYRVTPNYRRLTSLCRGGRRADPLLPASGEFLKEGLVQGLRSLGRPHRQEDVGSDELVNHLAVGGHRAETHLVALDDDLDL